MNSQSALADLIANLRTPAAPPAGPPCLDPWCANGATPCGHTADAHMAHHGAAAILAGKPTTTQASARIANRESSAVPGPVAQMPAAHAAAMETGWNHPATRAAIVAGHADPESIVNLPAPVSRPEVPPPSTVAEMRDVLTALDASRPRNLQTALGPSELGTPCQRQIAMKLAGLPRQLPDKRPLWAAMQGTAIHALMADALDFHNRQLGRQRWVIEQQLQIDAEVFGHGDAYDTDTGSVVDWKYVGNTILKAVKRKTIPNDQLVKPDYRVQGHLYGYGHERAGRPVRWVRLVFLARSHDYDQSTEWTEPYRPEIAIKALDRYYATQDMLAALDLATNPALWAVVPATAGASCDWCPFRRPAGPADATGCPGNTDQIVDKQTAGLIA